MSRRRFPVSYTHLDVYKRQVYTQCKDGTGTDGYLDEHRDAALRIQFEKDGSLINTGYCGISVKAGESYSLYLFAKAKEEIGLDVAIKYQGKVLTGNSLVVSGQEYTRYDMKLTAAEDCHEAQLTISCKEGGEDVYKRQHLESPL